MLLLLCRQDTNLQQDCQELLVERIACRVYWSNHTGHPISPTIRYDYQWQTENDPGSTAVVSISDGRVERLDAISDSHLPLHWGLSDPLDI